MAFTMYDDVRPELIPKDAVAVGWYVNGRYANGVKVHQLFPNAKKLSISVFASGDAECLDVERGDATNDQAPAWVQRQLKRGVYKPTVYTSASNVTALLKILAAHGIMRAHVRLWTAHYTGRRHICGPACGFGNWNADATQWTSQSHHISLDESWCLNDFLQKSAPAPAPKPAPTPVPKPTPAPAPTSATRFLRIVDKDGSKTWDPYTTLGRYKRGMQFARGKFKGVSVENEME